MPQENQDDENNGQYDFSQRVARIRNRAAYEIRAVVDGNDLHALRHPRFDFFESRFHAIDHFQGITSLSHDHDAGNCFPGSIQIRRAAPDVGTQHDFTYVLNANGRAALIGQNDVFKILR